jgi:hypothetical protein
MKACHRESENFAENRTVSALRRSHPAQCVQRGPLYLSHGLKLPASRSKSAETGDETEPSRGPVNMEHDSAAMEVRESWGRGGGKRGEAHLNGYLRPSSSASLPSVMPFMFTTWGPRRRQRRGRRDEGGTEAREGRRTGLTAHRGLGPGRSGEAPPLDAAGRAGRGCEWTAAALRKARRRDTELRSRACSHD